jgi:hypothetical protein
VHQQRLAVWFAELFHSDHRAVRARYGTRDDLHGGGCYDRMPRPVGPDLRSAPACAEDTCCFRQMIGRMKAHKVS